MKAMVQEKYGPADEVLELREIDKPVVRDEEVLVRVHAASLHPDVWHVVTGLPYALRLMGAGLRKPRRGVPGTDVAGRVDAVGKNVTKLAPGDEVFGEILSGNQWSHGGSYAEYVAVRESRLVRKPTNITFEQAAAVPTTGLIALRNLRGAGRLAAGQKVLINGAGGGVGTLGVQIAKAFGAEVTGVDHGSKLALLRSIGADHVIDYTRADFTQGPQRYDLILDVASNLRLRDCKRVLTPHGIYVLIGHEHYDETSRRWLGSLGHFFKLIARSVFDRHLPSLNFSMAQEEGMGVLRSLIETGKLLPVIDRTFPLAQVRDAIRYMKEGRGCGRVVITVGPAP
jgi:NADPH:quinone reductase-like Zn-dependent oxidoreductase